jgi:S-adenosylmethionine-diacylglycerol 3-amino-3-carboxypropyl transferase
MTRLVYNQVWEDYEVDRAALDVGPDDTVLLVTSGGCSVLNTLAEAPRRIVTVDANPQQGALLEEKLRIVRSATHDVLWERFGTPAQRQAGSLYTRGSYGRFAWVRAFIRAVCGRRVIDRFVSAGDIGEQGAIWMQEIEPRLFGPVARAMPAAFAGVCGMHWRQVLTTLQSGRFLLTSVCRERLRYVMTSFPIRENYFWHQMLTGEYASATLCPPYLRAENFERLREHAGVVDAHVGDLTELLVSTPAGTFTRVNLMDVPDFLSVSRRFALFAAVRRACAPGGRVVYRSFAPNLPIPAQLNGDSPGGFRFESEVSARLSAAERTASYGAVHLYTT